MSLLPSEIVPFTQPIGFVEIQGEDGQPSKRYEVQIAKNWWLLIYNIVKNSLGIDGGIPAEALALVDGADTDAADSDAWQAYQQVANSRLEFEVLPEGSRDAVSALLLDSPVEGSARAQPVAIISPGASPYTYTAPADGSVAVTGGTVSAISILRQGASVATGVTVGVIPLSRLDQIQVTYSGLPTMTFLPR